jgi:hypothetical protein
MKSSLHNLIPVLPSLLNQSQETLSVLILAESESYIMTDGQPASLSWNKAPIWGLRPDLDYCQTFAGLLLWGVLSDERTGLSFATATGLASAVFLGSESLETRDHILLSQF